ncbi:Methyltransferase domain-containing protein [Syntrophus gentianae]|uniref:Methyltransferase domain-containing protein n=1 Tax=Syntrophus gentianae TaxID=43775 RepID=A0A1H7UCY2_9BACT|nr:methyltransferase domain-containing protein [Syntrophus gentianae]SEL94811.1 Methyltransferase domain-containing protein [Syntrophus gentianae]
MGKPGISDYNDYWDDRIERKHYQYTDVHRKIVEVVEGVLGKEKARVLDCGVGPGHVFKELSGLYETYGLEISEKVFSLYTFDTSRIQIWDLNHGLPAFNPPLDLIIASRIIHHLADPVGFLGHVRRSLNRNGWFIGVIPNICYYHHRLKFLLGKFPPISGAHVNFQTGPTFEKMVVEQGFILRQLTTPKKTIRAKIWPTVFSQDLIYVFQKSET